MPDAEHMLDLAYADLDKAREDNAALRAERDALAKRVADLEDTIDCGCNALTDSIMASGNHPRTNLHWVAKMRRALGPADP